MEEKLYGTVVKIVYFKEENGFGIIRIKLNYQDNKIAKLKAKLFTNFLTVTCNFDRKPLIDEEYDFDGEFVETDYGTQFKAKFFERRNETTLEGVVTYLSSEFFPGIGRVTATKIFEELGKNCLSDIEENKDVLDKIQGLNQKQKDIIHNGIVENQGTKRATLALLNLGITMQMSLKLIKSLGLNAYEIIKNNPYILIDKIEGIGFQKADKIALDIGVKKDDPIRIKALLMYIINNLTYSNGDSYLDENELFESSKKIMNEDDLILSLNNFKEALIDLKNENKIVIDEENDIYHKKIYKAENLLSEKIYMLLNLKFDFGYQLEKIDTVFEDIKKVNNIIYSEKQEEAIKMALEKNIMIITGGPGTGKSTIIKGIVDCYSSLFVKSEIASNSIALLAPTGRAAKRLKEVTSHEAMTVHKFLGYEGNGYFKHGPEALVDAKMVIVDEFSMVDIELAARLFSSLMPNTKVVLVGDVDQLPSVGPGDVLNDLILSNIIPTVKLEKIHRQANNSSIIAFAHAINKGYLPNDLLDMQHDRNFIKMNDNNILSNIVKIISSALDKGMDLIKDIQVLVPLYKGDIGINAINAKLQDEFNPNNEDEIKHLNRVFRVNDKVIQLVNRSEKQVMNGDIGFVLSLDYQNKDYIGLTVMYDFGSVYYKKDELEDITHAYAISIHKAQGSEFDLVIVPFSYKYYIMLKRKLIYTAVTRAKKYLIMVGNIESLAYGIKGVETKRRTKLMKKINHEAKSLNLDDLILDDNMENVSPYDFMD